MLAHEFDALVEMDFDALTKDFAHSKTGKVLIKLCKLKFIFRFVTIFTIKNCVLKYLLS